MPIMIARDCRSGRFFVRPQNQYHASSPDRSLRKLMDIRDPTLQIDEVPHRMVRDSFLRRLDGQGPWPFGGSPILYAQPLNSPAAGKK
jgi:hypothetical protein